MKISAETIKPPGNFLPRSHNKEATVTFIADVFLKPQEWLHLSVIRKKCSFKAVKFNFIYIVLNHNNSCFKALYFIR